MAFANEHYLEVNESYLFSTIAARIRDYVGAHPEAALIRLGIGDVTLPLPGVVTDALRRAADEMGRAETFRGYGPEQGYDFLREKIAATDYLARGIRVGASEIFISDGAKCDTGNILEIFGNGNRVAIPDPVYPVYVDTNIMAGRRDDILYIGCDAETGFKPRIPDEKADIIYLCYPNNPTGTVLTAQELKQWVDYALTHRAIILYDAAYEAYIRDPALPRSIYEIDGARDCAIEFRSFSKTAGFTGLRCAYTVVPEGLSAVTAAGYTVLLHRLWFRRQSTKFNGVSYVVQKAAEALYGPGGREAVEERIACYMENARMIRECLQRLGYTVYGGEHAPYVWMKTPDGMDSWAFFDHLLARFRIAGTPGSGFGRNGEGYFRLTGFGSRENTLEAVRRLSGGSPGGD